VWCFFCGFLAKKGLGRLDASGNPISPLQANSLVSGVTMTVKLTDTRGTQVPLTNNVGNIVPYSPTANEMKDLPWKKF
jgi:hypothetical protein